MVARRARPTQGPHAPHTITARTPIVRRMPQPATHTHTHTHTHDAHRRTHACYRHTHPRTHSHSTEREWAERLITTTTPQTPQTGPACMCQSSAANRGSFAQHTRPSRLKCVRLMMLAVYRVSTRTRR